MANPERVVIDTNVLVSAALLRRSSSRRAFDLAMARAIPIVTSATVAEISEVLWGGKFDRYIDDNDRVVFLAGFLSVAEIVSVTEHITACRDPDDDRILEAAVSGGAHCIVTGDDDLLALHSFRGILILTVSDFITRFETA